MRLTSAVMFFRLIGAGGVGAFLGAAVAGLFAVLTGQAFRGSTAWLTGLPVLLLFGAVLGVIVAWISQAWLAPRAPRRRVLFTVIGLVALPLAAALGSSGLMASVGLPLIFIGFAATATLWVRALRQHQPARRGGRAPSSRSTIR